MVLSYYGATGVSTRAMTEMVRIIMQISDDMEINSNISFDQFNPYQDKCSSKLL